ncbi:S24 family peptidase [Candidatus Palauibacter sp.]|uniref:S24 family peptidase n=1 Tax=Candidatus Palauibacter sp. TaxID=3101350 RepID=UPI003B518960
MGRRRKDADQLDPVRRRLLRLLDESRTTMRTASQAIQRNDAYLHQFIHRGTPKVLAEDDREALAEHLGCSPDLLRHDRRLTRRARPNPAPPSPYAAPRGYSAVPEINVRASAGPGAWNDDFEEETDTWLFADPLIRHEFRARPEDLRMITVDGDSMEPVLSSGDRILIDVSLKVPVPPGIFVIWDGMGLVAKRIEHLPHSEPPKVVLKSLNPEYDSYECAAEEVRVVGRAVWASRRL